MEKLNTETCDDILIDEDENLTILPKLKPLDSIVKDIERKKRIRALEIKYNL